jgi:hypothetical protein
VETNGLQPEEAKAKGGMIAGRQAADSGRLRDAAVKGIAGIAEQYCAWRLGNQT